MFTRADRGLQTAPIDNAPITDTFKPPEGGSNVSLVQIPPAEVAPSTPPFNFSVNSDSAGIHNLRFAINNGSNVCGSQNSQTFVTK